jgi:ankyrin repeat protein
MIDIQTFILQCKTKSPLIFACIDNDPVAVQKIVDSKTDLDYADGMAISRACENGFLEIVQILIKAGASIHTDRCFEPLDLASECGHYKIVRVLLDAGALNGPRKNFALFNACWHNHYSVVVELLKENIVVHKDRGGYFWANYKGHSEIVKLLDSYISERNL